MGRLLGEIPSPEPEGTRPPPAWYHEPMNPERIAWLTEERQRCRARVDELRALLFAELTHEQANWLWGLVLSIQYCAVADRIILCMHGSACENPELGLSALAL